MTILKRRRHKFALLLPRHEGLLLTPWIARVVIRVGAHKGLHLVRREGMGRAELGWRWLARSRG